jgi:hypothetical protein
MRIALLMGGAGLMLACADSGTPSSPAIRDAGPGASVAVTSGQGSGAIITRFEGNTPETGLFIYDADEGLLAAVATDDTRFGCVPGTSLGHSQDMLIETPAGAAIYLSRVDQVYLTIYEWSGVGPIDCGLVRGPAIAEGIVPGVLVSNDIFDGGGRAGRLGMVVQGEIRSLTTGAATHVVAQFLDLHMPSGEWRSITASIHFSRDPRS